MERIIALRDAGVVQVPPIETYALENAAAALTKSAGRHLTGKLVLQVR